MSQHNGSTDQRGIGVGPPAETIRVLHVDDEVSFGDLVATYLERESERFEVETVSKPSEAIDRLATNDGRIDCVVSDYNMPRMDGIELLKTIREDHPDLPFILFTGKGSEEVASEALAAGATDYFQKRSGAEQYELLANKIENAHERTRTADRVEHLKHIRYLVGSINRALVGSPTRQEIETRVCELISDAEPYKAGCIAGLDLDSDRVRFRSWTGIGAGDFEEHELLIGKESNKHEDPFTKAVIERDIAVSRDIEDDLQQDWIRTQTLKQGLESLAVVPLEYSGELHGLLTVFGLRSGTFHEMEQKVLNELGDDIAHALHARRVDIRLDQVSEEFSTVFDQAKSGLMLVDYDDGIFRYRRANQRMSELIDEPRHEIQGKTPRQVFESGKGGEIASAYHSCIQNNKPVEYTVTSDTEEETAIREGTVTPINDNGDIDKLVVVVRDITQQHERKEELKRITRRFKALFDKSPDMIDVVSTDGTIKRANQQFCDKLGRSEEEIVNKKIWDIDRAANESDVRSLLSSTSRGERRRFEGRYERRDGSTFPVEVHLIRLDIEEDSRFLVISRDITDRKSLEAERETTTEFLRELYDVTVDTEASFEEKLRRTLELGRTTLELSNGFLTDIETDSEGVDSGQQQIVEAQGPHELLQSGESCPLSEAYCRKTIEADGLLAVRDAVDAGWDGDPAYQTFELGSYIGGKVEVGEDLYGTLCFAATDGRADSFTDTERMYVRLMSRWMGYEIERREKEREIERQNERLEEFVGVASHDLRNPLSVAEARLDLARQNCDSDHLKHVANAHSRMEQLIDDLLSLATSGESISEVEPVALAETARECWENIKSGAATLNIETGCTLDADLSRLQQLLENLMRNSVEHSEERITVTIGGLPDRSGFYVADNGPGIPEDERHEVFETGYSSSSDGTGFGLSILKQIVEGHGWDICVTESSEDGARFEITGVDVA